LTFWVTLGYSDTPMDKIICAHCGKEFEITEALTHQIEEKLVIEAKELAFKEASEKFEREHSFEQQKLAQEATIAKESQEKLQGEILAMTRQMREMQLTAESSKVLQERKLAEQEDIIRREERAKSETVQQLKLLEKDKLLADALKKNEELKQKLTQGSQQTQGEVLELSLEEMLRTEFPQDEIQEVAKGVRGADIIQIVRDKYGRACGSIIWETKNAKWSNSWLDKLKSDQRAAKADIAVLSSIHVPEEVKQFVLRNGVWICTPQSMVSLATALRLQIYQVFITKSSVEQKSEQVEALYNYFTSPEFSHRIETIMDTFESMQKEIDTERKWFNAKWERQEKLVRKALDSTSGMYGSLQGALGEKLPELERLSLQEEN